MNDYKTTLLLPKTDFPMRAKLQVLEKKIQAFWYNKQIYNQLLVQNQQNPARIIFDGPPYSNGSIHLGTSLNKILKDIFVRYFFQQKYYSEFIYGWDMFGLPIENAVLKYLSINDNILKTISGKERIARIQRLRGSCHSYSNSFLITQGEEFSALGMLAPTSEHYKTSSHRYTAEILNVYEKLSNSSLINRAYYPTWWSFKKQTSVAESDITYKKIQIKDALFSYEIVHENTDWQKLQKPISFLVWTSSVWTITGNFMLAINIGLQYVIVEIFDKYYVVAKKRIQPLAKRLNLSDIPIIYEMKNYEELLLASYKEPFRNKINNVFHSSHVNANFGTGVVHISPAHARSDYLLAKKNFVKYHEVISPTGHMINSDIYDNMFFYKAVPQILNEMNTKKMLIQSNWVVHEQPFYTTLNEPLFTVSTKQYFLSLINQKKSLKQFVSRSTFYPQIMQEKLNLSLSSRSEWCISRQRFWGVPIPEGFVQKKQKVNSKTKDVRLGPITLKTKLDWTPLSCEFVHRAIAVLQKKGTNAWYEGKLSNFFSQKELDGFQKKNMALRLETSILDVWFDSSCAMHIVKNFFQRDKIRVNDFVLIEGIDQHRGWFNASFIMLNALEYQKGPRDVVTHGFVVDNNNNKMSKSIGNIINPIEFINKHGAEILRLFFANSKFINNIIVSQKNIDFAIAHYRRFRNTIKWLLGICNNYQFDLHYLNTLLNNQTIVMSDNCCTNYNYIILSKLQKVINKYHNEMAEYRLWFACRLVENFITNDLSANYAVYIKDILYIHHQKSPERQAAMNVIVLIAITLIKLMAPILPHTAEEWFQHFRKEVINQQLIKIKDLKNSLFLYPTITKLIIRSPENAKQLMSFYDDWFPRIRFIIHAAMTKNNKHLLYSHKFRKLEQVCFLYTPQPHLSNCLDAKTIQLFVSFARVRLVQKAETILQYQPPFYTQIIDTINRKKINIHFQYVALSFFRGKKCQRCWKYFAEKKFIPTKQLCKFCDKTISMSKNST